MTGDLRSSLKQDFFLIITHCSHGDNVMLMLSDARGPIGWLLVVSKL